MDFVEQGKSALAGRRQYRAGTIRENLARSLAPACKTPAYPGRLVLGRSSQRLMLDELPLRALRRRWRKSEADLRQERGD